MSPRPKRRRILKEPPTSLGFTPVGMEFDTRPPVTLHFEEYEALRLADYDSLNQEDAAKQLQVSRPTFTRIYSTARKKVATAFVENRPITVQGGDVTFESNWFQCNECGSVFTSVKEDAEMKACPVCAATEIIPLQQAVDEMTHWHDHPMKGQGRGRHKHAAEKCICPKCDHEEEHEPGRPCFSMLCPQCSIRMVRKGSPRHKFILEKRKANKHE